jgi:hypothetical protein
MLFSSITKFFKHVKNLGYNVLYKTDFRFKHCYILTQSLAFIPTDDVLEGFLKVKYYCFKSCAAFEPYLDYIETYYVGKLDDKLHKRLKPYLSIPTWNYHRIINNKPRTNNKVKRFNQKIQVDNDNHHLSFTDMIEALRLEKVNTESLVVEINMG